MAKEAVNEKKHFNIFSFFVKTIFLLLLGFLPSFIYVALFVQYGSILTNYINFLSNYESSIGAWAAAGVIILLGYFILWIIKSRSTFNKGLKNKFILAILILSFLVIIALIVVQLYLYINFTLGSDILIKLSADKDNLFFTNNSQAEVNFKISVVTNPFCSAKCSYNFFDVGLGKNIETGSFNITAVLPKTKTYSFTNDYLSPGSQSLKTFEVKCESQRTILCYTKEEESTRSVLITINYELSQEDLDYKEYSKEKLYSFFDIYSSILSKLNQSRENLMVINSSFDYGEDATTLDSISLDIEKINQSLYIFVESWNSYDFSSLRNILPDLESKLKNLNIKTNNVEVSIEDNMILYNSLINNFTFLKSTLESVSQMNIAPGLCTKLNDVIIEFNSAVSDLSNLNEAVLLYDSVSVNVSSFYIEALAASGDALCNANDIIMENFAYTYPVIFSNITYVVFLEEPSATCCYFGDCNKCCNNNCSKENYPVIFLHGHSVNQALPPDYSLDTFVGIKNKLVSEGYIDAGAVLLSSVSEESGLWGRTNIPLIVTASYFFDTYKTEDGETTVSSNTDSIDTYAIRLKSIVELVKYRTGKDKVVIVAHSMGGLVTRRYIQIFGGSNVDKIFLVDVPNHGISDKVKDYCAVFGQEVACNEMDKNSILINKLNNAATDKVNATNIIGIGCNMGDETGDGIVKNSSQYLDYAQNYYIKGICNELSFEYLHNEILYPDQYPKLFDLLNNFLKS